MRSRRRQSAFSHGIQYLAFSQHKTNRVEIVDENCMVSGCGVVKMYYFAIDFACEMPYPLAPPQGWEVV